MPLGDTVHDVFKLLERKGLQPDIFVPALHPPLTLQSDMNKHVDWAFKHIYSRPYPAHKTPRGKHGILHVSRVACYVKVFVNLYLRHNLVAANELTAEDVKLLELAGLFHDCAREDDGEDKWDSESAIFFYYYLTRVLAVDKQKARVIAEAIANKDYSAESRCMFVINDIEGQVSFEYQETESICKKNLYQQIIHDSDCLDIIRARLHFDGSYLDFYKNINQSSNPNLALDEMAHLIMEARSLIEIQGDSYHRQPHSIKEKYEVSDAYRLVTADIQASNYPILQTLGETVELRNTLPTEVFPLVDLTAYDTRQGLTAKNLSAAAREGRLFSRGIPRPSSIRKKNGESLGEVEIRKTTRTFFVPSQTTKSNQIEKEGNPFRSISMLGYGSIPFSRAGFLLIDPAVEDIVAVCEVDDDSGRQKKTSCQKNLQRSHRTPSEIEEQLRTLHHNLKLGGKSRVHAYFSKSTHNEILCHLKKYDALYYSSDPTFVEEEAQGDDKLIDSLSPLLQAVFLQKQYERYYDKTRNDYLSTFDDETLFLERFGFTRTLPLFHYSGVHNRIDEVDFCVELTDDALVEKWKTICAAYMARQIKKFDVNIYTMSVNDIKILSVYKLDESMKLSDYRPADFYYSRALQDRINAVIQTERSKIIEKQETFLLEKMQSDDSFIFSDECFFSLLRNPYLLARVDMAQLQTQLETYAQRDDLFSGKLPRVQTELGHISYEHTLTLSDRLKHLSFKPHERLIFETIPVKLYALAIQANLASLVSLMQHRAREAAIQQYEEITRIITTKTYFNFETIINLFHFTQLFNIETDLEAWRERAIEQHLIQEIEKAKDLPTIPHSIVRLGWLTPRIIEILQPYMDILRRRALEKDRAVLVSCLLPSCRGGKMEPFWISEQLVYRFSSYLKFLSFVKEDPLPTAMKWIAGQTQTLTEVNLRQLLRLIKEYAPTLIHHLPFFSALMNAIATKEMHGPVNYETPHYWLKSFQSCKKIIDNGTFSTQQIEIIRRCYHDVCDRYLSENHPFEILLGEIKNILLIAEILLPMPLNLVNAFNRGLPLYLEKQKPDVNDPLIGLIKTLHEQLDLKEERIDYLEALTQAPNTPSSIGFC